MALCHQFLIPLVCFDRDLVDLSRHGRVDRYGRRHVGARRHNGSRYLRCSSREARGHCHRCRRCRYGRWSDVGDLGIRLRDAGCTVLGRVRPIVVESCNHDFKWLHFHRSFGNSISLRQRVQIHLDAFSGESTKTTPERTQPRGLLVVECHRDVRPIPKALAHESREDCTRADLYEVRDAGVVHRVHHLTEAHRRSQLFSEESASGLACLRVDLAGRVCIDIDIARAPLDRTEVVVERLDTTGDDARVECRSHRETDRAHSRLFQLGREGIDGFHRARDDDLVGRVVIRDNHT